MPKSPLEGIKVLDFTQAMAGPFATMLLGDLGCDVIKVEPPHGDQTRKWAPPFTNGMSSYFLGANRNKRSIVIDLGKNKGKLLAKRLAEKCDVIVENFRPGTMERLGLGYEVLREINPSIIYCSISGFGETGPFRDFPGYDLTTLSYTGLLDLTGEEDGPPVKFGVPIGDIVSGLFADISLLSALMERNSTGKGQRIDLSMFDANLLTLTYQAYDYFSTGVNPKRQGSAHSSIAPYQVFKTSDGHVSICVGTEKLWNSLVGCLNLDAIAQDNRFLTNSDRVQHRKELAEAIDSHTRNLKTSVIIEKLKKAGIPSAPINSVSEALQSEQTVFRDMVTSITGEYGEIKSLGSPFKMSRTPGRIRIPPPVLGQHTMQILEEIGVDQETILDLKRNEIINSEPRKDEEI